MEKLCENCDGIEIFVEYPIAFVNRTHTVVGKTCNALF